MRNWFTEKVYNRFDATWLMTFAIAMSNDEFVIAISSILIGSTISAIIDIVRAEKDAL